MGGRVGAGLFELASQLARRCRMRAGFRFGALDLLLKLSHLDIMARGRAARQFQLPAKILFRFDRGA